nr:uncharacterized protein LOC112918838 [Vulpes vulpes]
MVTHPSTSPARGDPPIPLGQPQHLGPESRDASSLRGRGFVREKAKSGFRPESGVHTAAQQTPRAARGWGPCRHLEARPLAPQPALSSRVTTPAPTHPSVPPLLPVAADPWLVLRRRPQTTPTPFPAGVRPTPGCVDTSLVFCWGNTWGTRRLGPGPGAPAARLPRAAHVQVSTRLVVSPTNQDHSTSPQPTGWNLRGDAEQQPGSREHARRPTRGLSFGVCQRGASATVCRRAGDASLGRVSRVVCLFVCLF